MAGERFKDVILSELKLITSVNGSFIGENFSELKNMRYIYGGLQGVGGMSKINSTPTYYTKMVNAFFYVTEYGDYIIAQAKDPNSPYISRLYIMDSTIPGAGSWQTLYDEGANVPYGRFSETPNEFLVYCNEEESLIYGGDESRVSAFINFDTGYEYDYTERVNNDLQDDENCVILTGGGGLGGNDDNCVLLMHQENNLDDDSAGGLTHTITNYGTTWSGGAATFGSYGAVFNGTSTYFTINDDADFDWTQAWTLDLHFTVDPSATFAHTYPIFMQYQDSTHYIKVWVATDRSMHMAIYNGASSTSATIVGAGGITKGVDYHFEISATAKSTTSLMRVFLDGVLTYSNTTSNLTNLTGVVNFGKGETTFFYGYMDEIRFSDVVRHTSNFTIPTAAYSSSSFDEYFYIGSLVPIDGFKLYINQANEETSTMTVEYWNGVDWVGVSDLSDGTDSGGVSLAQTGSVSFDSTVETAKIKIINQVAIYWYRVYVDSITAETKIYKVSLSVPMQPIKDIWDGFTRKALGCFYSDNGNYLDNTLNVYDEDYDVDYESSFMDVSSLVYSEDAIYIGFNEPIIGLYVVMGAVNTNTSTLTVSYWDGSDWVAFTSISDGTTPSGVGKSFNNTGIVSWDSSVEGAFKKSLISGDFPLYYYKLTFSASLSTSVHVDHISGIPQQKKMGVHSFPFYAQNRVWLCCDNNGEKNSAICSAAGTSVVFNGDDSAKIVFGDTSPLVGAVNLYSQIGSNLYDIMVFLKKDETWIVVGNGPDNWVKYKTSDILGCVAPLTIATIHVEFEVVPGLNRGIAIWQTSSGIYLFDGKTYFPIHRDIADLFDMRNTNGLNRSLIDKSYGFIDDQWQEYHWLCATGSSTTLNREFVFSFIMQKWFEIDRGTGKRILCGIRVNDSYGNFYNYGLGSAGYMYRLEYGNTFDGNGIPQSFQLGNLKLTKGLCEESQLRKVQLISKAKTTTTNEVTVSYFGDSETSSTRTRTLTQGRSGYYVSDDDVNFGKGFYKFHSLKFELTTSDETYGFEPYAVSMLFDVKGYDNH